MSTRGNPVSTKVVNRGKSWFSPSHRIQPPCFISLQALLSCGALERARSTLKAHKVFFDNPGVRTFHGRAPAGRVGRQNRPGRAPKHGRAATGRRQGALPASRPPKQPGRAAAGCPTGWQGAKISRGGLPQVAKRKLPYQNARQGGGMTPCCRQGARTARQGCGRAAYRSVDHQAPWQGGGRVPQRGRSPTEAR
jgi:hypothetical protein